MTLFDRPFFSTLCALLVHLSCAGLFGCESGTPARRSDIGATVLVDALGDTLRLDAPPRRLVSLAPSLTEMVYALGEEDRLVGVTEFCDYPPEAATKPRVAGFNVINLELLVAAHPDLVLANRGNSPADLAAIRQVRIPVFAFQIDSLPALLEGIETLGVLLGNRHAADSLRSSWEARMNRVSAAVRAVPPNKRPRAFFGGTQEPIYSVGPGSFVHDLILRAGGRNIFDDMGAAWPRIDLETLVKRDPNVILVGYHEGADTAQVLERLRDAPGWRSLRAVREGRVVVLGDAVMREGPRLIDALEAISHALYPDRRG